MRTMVQDKVMNITQEKFRKDTSCFYKAGFKSGFYLSIIKMRQILHDNKQLSIPRPNIEDLILILIEYYNSYPCLDNMELHDDHR